MFGFLNVNKPTGVTSRYVVNQIQRMLHPIKVGHAGTLDPLATGVLVVAIGPATRLIPYLNRKPKSYIGSFRLGLRSDSQDIEGDLEPVHTPNAISGAEIESVLPHLTGRIKQIPPKYSAIKIDGKRAYRMARKGDDFIMPEREVEIIRLELKSFAYPDFEIEVKCSSGTYIRTLGSDIAKACQSDAVMTSLRRTQVATFDIANSSEIGQLESKSILVERIESPTAILRKFPRETVEDSQVTALEDGKSIKLSNKESELAAVNNGRLIAIMERTHEGIYKPKTNFARYWASQNKLESKQASS